MPLFCVTTGASESPEIELASRFFLVLPSRANYNQGCRGCESVEHHFTARAYANAAASTGKRQSVVVLSSRPALRLLVCVLVSQSSDQRERETATER